ncbi:MULTISPECIES: cupin domain-containing protein [Gemella]|uniref:cupin domain-containing protein n=1 Tax=Gemella TaxID=1378 RepID=UPI0007683952|nr:MULTISPECIES: cupin domain-containing protein [Gemella]AME09366.1 LytTR family transcriptional regulator [Gemella sp. oral taxon 928]AXI27002.1 cupin domain-containing protein [Gemella sp. ND 6198]
MEKFEPLFNLGNQNINYKEFFIGESYINMLVSDKDIDVKIANVTFEPACRNDWHIHHNGYQILMVTDGKGWYQEENKSAQKLTKGDVVIIKDAIKHWHGATKDSWFSHVAITTGTAEWLEKVIDSEYNKL